MRVLYFKICLWHRLWVEKRPPKIIKDFFRDVFLSHFCRAEYRTEIRSANLQPSSLMHPDRFTLLGSIPPNGTARLRESASPLPPLPPNFLARKRASGKFFCDIFILFICCGILGDGDSDWSWPSRNSIDYTLLCNLMLCHVDIYLMNHYLPRY